MNKKCRERKAAGFEPVKCRMCGTMFKPKHRRHKNCTPKCAYISDRISRNCLQGMSRDEAIAYYGEMYEDPLHSLLRSKHKSLVRVIYNYCEANNTTTFTQREIASLGQIKMHSQSLAVCANNVSAVSKTGYRVKAGPGKSVIEWQFHKELLNTGRW